MSAEVTEPVVADAQSAQRVRGALGLLGDFNRAGVLGAADVHVATRLARLAGEGDERVLLAAALAVRALRAGSVLVDLATVQSAAAVEDVAPEALAALGWPDPERWLSVLADSRLVAVGLDAPTAPPGSGEPADAPGAARPLRLLGSTVYLDRYWRQEQLIAEALDAAARRTPPVVDDDRLATALDRLFPDAADGDRQRLAADLVAHRWVGVLAGGPGTGKTTTVAKLLAALQDQAGGRLRVALAAPTAVAAARLTAATHGVAGDLEAVDRDRLSGLEASTLHRLLGRRPGSRTRFRHDRDNRLPADVVVVDEASMVSLTLMARLVDALRPDCRLVLVGDPDQLASVEAGAVLGDLVLREPPLDAQVPLPTDLEGLDAEDHAAVRRGVVQLTRVHRFAGDIAEFAEAVRSGDPLRVGDVLAGQHPSIEFVDTDPDPATDRPTGAGDLTSLRADVVRTGAAVHAAAAAGDGQAALTALAGHRVLCAHREGAFGVRQWGDRAEAWLREEVTGYGAEGQWYVGRPLLVTANDYQLRLFNGDTGVVVDSGGSPRAAFVRGAALDLLAPSRLPDARTLHAMSVHRSQGSQFERVTLVLPPAGSPLLTRELLYTGLTRARVHVRIIGSRTALATAVSRPIVRASGLRNRRE